MKLLHHFAKSPNRIKHTSLFACLFLIFAFYAPPVTALADNPYSLKRQDTTTQKALFILSPDLSNANTIAASRRNFDVFRQIISSYWGMEPASVEVGDYERGQIDDYDVIIVADEQGEELPWALIEDMVTASDKEVVHFGLGGHRLLRLVSFAPMFEYKEFPPIKQVRYKGVELNGGAYDNDLLYGLNQPYEPPSGVGLQTPLTTYDHNGEEVPAAFRVTTNRFRQSPAGYLFFPFSVPRYYDTQSYTNALLDALHLSFGNTTNYPKRALIRLEDVNAYTYSRPKNGFFKSYDYLKSEKVPFHVALIERYVNPGDDTDSSTANHRHFNYFLHKMVGEGDAVIVQHGYTHQYKDEVSAAGFEFWDDKLNKPAEDDSPIYTQGRIDAVRAAMRDNGLPVPDIWETPHYARGPFADRILNGTYPLRYETILTVGSLPFPVMIDDTIYIPETLGYINGDWAGELAGFKQRLEQLQVFRNATASFFWHPWRETHELRTLVKLLKEQGYQFVPAYDLLQAEKPGSGIAAYQQFKSSYSDSKIYLTINAGVLILYLIMLLGVIRYLHDRFRFRKYFKLTTRFNKSLKATEELYESHDKELPTFAIFVPARNEGLVIANTIENLTQLDYPRDKYQIVIITDERELDDNVDVLTKTEVDRKTQELRQKNGHNLVACIEVPEHYSGIYNDNAHTHEKSTKGRALNYALQVHELPESWESVDFIGILDADGRLNKHVLKEAAWEAFKRGALILQGPVYQVSNLSKVSIVGIMAGLELARYHLTNMIPSLVHPRKVQFLAGTNYFINRQLLEEVNGWDQHALVEDAELALRVYTKKRVVAHALTLPEIEQTPEKFKIYRKQRERWARGHFEILGDILRAQMPFMVKLVFIRKIVLSQFRFILDLSIPLLAALFLIMGYFREVVIWMQIASIVLIVAVVFMWDIYGQTYRRIARYSDMPKKRSQLIMSVKLFIFMPAFMIIQAIPRIDALYNFATRKKVVWAKTERTSEKPINKGVK